MASAFSFKSIKGDNDSSIKPRLKEIIGEKDIPIIPTKIKNSLNTTVINLYLDYRL